MNAAQHDSTHELGIHGDVRARPVHHVSRRDVGQARHVSLRRIEDHEDARVLGREVAAERGDVDRAGLCIQMSNGDARRAGACGTSVLREGREDRKSVEDDARHCNECSQSGPEQQRQGGQRRAGDEQLDREVRDQRERPRAFAESADEGDHQRADGRDEDRDSEQGARADAAHGTCSRSGLNASRVPATVAAERVAAEHELRVLRSAS